MRRARVAMTRKYFSVLFFIILVEACGMLGRSGLWRPEGNGLAPHGLCEVRVAQEIQLWLIIFQMLIIGGHVTKRGLRLVILLALPA